MSGLLQMVMPTMRLFVRGKLFRDGSAAFKQWLIGFAVTSSLLVILGWLISPLAGVLVASAVGGALQPYLFKNLKYA